jgi:glycosyltransferase involved in cell wall biosynthesis
VDRLLTVVICTHNRAEHLQRCVESLLHQTADSSVFEILIVDNASRDETASVAARYSAAHANVRDIHESVTGLSHARNAGIRAAESQWIAYVDDDAIPHPDWAERLLLRIETDDFDAYGGLYLPYFDGPPPGWYLDRYNSNTWMLRDGEPFYEVGPSDPKLSGGNCAFRLAALESLGGFSTELGMRGDERAYSEEVEVQNRMLDAGYRLAFDADWRVDHFTAPYKQHLGWFMLEAFRLGRDQVTMDLKRHPSTWKRFEHCVVRAGYGAAKEEWRALRTSLGGLRDGSYCWQNVVIDVARPALHYLGKLWSLSLLLARSARGLGSSSR